MGGGNAGLGHEVAGGAKSPTGVTENRGFYQGHSLAHSTSDSHLLALLLLQGQGRNAYSWPSRYSTCQDTRQNRQAVCSLCGTGSILFSTTAPKPGSHQEQENKPRIIQWLLGKKNR